MSSRERVVSALSLEEPDRVPVFEMHIPPEIGAKLLGRTPIAWNTPLQLAMCSRGETYGLDEKVARDILEVHKGLSLDMIRCPGSAQVRGEVTQTDDDTWLIDGVAYSWLSGSLWRRDWPIVDPETVLHQSRSTGEGPLQELRRNMTVLTRLRSTSLGEFFITYDADGSWGPIVSNPPLLTNVLQWMYTQPAVVETLLDSLTSTAVEAGKMALDEGADGILMCVDYGNSRGPWMKPDHFRRFVKPRLRRQCEVFRKRGGFAILHSDGNVQALLADVVDAGVDAYQGIDVHAGMDLQAVKETNGGRIALIGNVSPHVLEFDSDVDVAREVDRCMKAAAPGGGYILSASANVSIGTNARNFRAMVERGHRTGTYPVRARVR